MRHYFPATVFVGDDEATGGDEAPAGEWFFGVGGSGWLGFSGFVAGEAGIEPDRGEFIGDAHPAHARLLAAFFHVEAD